MLTTATVVDTGNVLVDALTWGKKWVSFSGPLQIKVGFKLIDNLIPTLAEINAVQAVLAEFERVINVDFQYIGIDTTGSADLSFQIQSETWDSSYGWSIPPGETRYAAYGDANILRNNYEGSGNSFNPGSFDYITFVHEFAHVMGLAHPHDTGGGSGIFPGVTSPQSTGYFGLNQGVYTTMSYVDGSDTTQIDERVVLRIENEVTGQIYIKCSPRLIGQTQSNTEFGLQSGLMALDILALQNIYGANTSYNSDNTHYVLPALNAPGSSFISIWDTGGVDTISTLSTADATIDLRAASGLVAEGGGGFISAVRNVAGGFTIAAGAIIENATGGIGNDLLTGNATANILNGGAGHDQLTGLGGRDELWGGAGQDHFVFLSNLDSGPTYLSGDLIKDFNINDDLIDLIGIDANNQLAGNQAFQFIGAASSFAMTGDLRFGYNSGNTVLYLNTDADMSSESVIVLAGIHALSADDFLL
jgi:serralysin